MKTFYRPLLLSFLIITVYAVTDCERAILNTLKNSNELLTQVSYSGKYFNELGFYQICQFESPNYRYALALTHDDPYNFYDLQAMWGFCISKNCSRSSFTAINQFLNTSARFLGLNPSYIEYLFPYDDLQNLRIGL